MKNVTIAIDEALFAAAKNHPEVRKTSLSAFIAELLRREIEPRKDDPESLMVVLDQAARSATKTWKWNRDEIYERD